MKAKEFLIILAIILVLVVLIAVLSKDDKVDVPANNNPSQGSVEGNDNNSTLTNNEDFVSTGLDGTKINTSDELKKVKTFEDLEFSNIKIVTLNNSTDLTADIKNPTSKTLGNYPIDITVLDKDGKTLTVIGGYVDTVEAGKTVKLNAGATSDFANAYDFKITKK